MTVTVKATEKGTGGLSGYTSFTLRVDSTGNKRLIELEMEGSVG